MTVLVLELAIGALLAAGVTLLIHAALHAAASRSKERALFKSLQNERDARRTTKPIERIYAEDWGDPRLTLAEFDRIWKSLATSFEIDPTLMRPGDPIADTIVATESFGPDGFECVEFIIDNLPRVDARIALAALEQGEIETVGDLLRAIIRR